MTASVTRVPPRTLSLSVRNDLTEIAQVRQHIEAFLVPAQVPVHYAADLVLAADELLTNIITYGYDSDSAAEIRVRLRLWADRVEMEIEDAGRAFNPLAATAPDLTAALEDRAIGGLGLYLVQQKMERLEYRRAAEKNVLTLTIQLFTEKGNNTNGMCGRTN